MHFYLPPKLMSDYNGYQILVNLFEQTKTIEGKTITIDFSNTSWFEANLCAALGAILVDLEVKNNQIQLINFSNSVKLILEKNLFLLNFSGKSIEDNYATTIKYQKFEITAEQEFADYLDRELLSQPDLPKMTPMLKRKINRSIYEIYNNAYSHGKCINVFTCGQYFPNKKKLYFTIVDLGNTIRNNVRKYLNNNEMSGKDCINWAVEEGNTTRTGSTPGGLGLSLIRDFLKLNEGRIQIISSNGYWEEKKGTILAADFKSPFLGTIVNLEFNLNDNNSYALLEELKPEDYL
ncbi:MAG: ATP-binding protein [Bacteroidia bacterium]